MNIVIKRQVAVRTPLTGWKPVKFTVRFHVGDKPVKGVRAYDSPAMYTLRELCIRADRYGLTERELAYIVSMRPGGRPFVNEDFHITRRP